MTIEFQAWPKIARLNRNITITEKIDGTNAAVGILSAEQQAELGIWTPGVDPEPDVLVYAQSRTRIITPEKDNFGFAAWVRDHAEDLATLGAGLHFGEWWGNGIQRGYGLPKDDKRFSLFNTSRWADVPDGFMPACVSVVPVLYQGLYDNEEIERALARLRYEGSVAAPGFTNPEGIVVFHSASSTMYKVTLEGDAQPKGQAAA